MIKKPFVVGLDFAKIPLTQVETNAVQASIDRLPTKSKKFNLIILTEVLEHLDDEIYIKAIEEIKRLKGNYLLITVPFDENPFSAMAAWFKTDEGIFSVDHKTFYCALTLEGYHNMLNLIEPFCVKDSKGYQYLYDIDNPTDFLFAPAGTR